MLVPARLLSRNVLLVGGCSKMTCVRCSHPPKPHGAGDDDKSSTNIDTKSTISPETFKLDLNKVRQHLVLHKADIPSVSSGDTTKPLVLLFQWLYAKPKHVKKYCALYHDLGLDVLAVRGKLSHFMWPPDGSKLAQELFAYLRKKRPVDEKILVHALSAGVYNYTIAMEAASKTPEECGFFRDKVMGQIFESVVLGDVESISRHQFQQILPANESFRSFVHETISIYYSMTKSKTKDTYTRLCHHLKEEPIPVPTLIYYSVEDPICDRTALEATLSQWRSRHPDFHITTVSWPGSLHTAHLTKYEKEYITAWRSHMERLHIIQSTEQ